MMRGNRRGTKARQSTRTAQRQALQIPHPPSIGSFAVSHNVRLRFIANAAVNVNVSWQNILDTIVIASTALSVQDVFHIVRLKRVQVWSIPAQGTTNTVSVAFTGLTTAWAGDAAVHTDTSMGVEPAYVCARPARRSVASDFQLSATSSAFTLICPVGSVIDLEATFRNVPGKAVTALNASVGATIGAMSFRGLDGLPASTTVMTPAIGPVV
jgi:hypothetical protein